MKALLLFALILIVSESFSQVFTARKGVVVKKNGDSSYTISTDPNYDPREDTAYRELEFQSRLYKIRYIYDGSSYMDPLIFHRDANGNETPFRHYETAIITVFQKEGKFWVQMGKSLSGTYVPDGCFEDIPEHWVCQVMGIPYPKED